MRYLSFFTTIIIVSLSIAFDNNGKPNGLKLLTDHNIFPDKILLLGPSPPDIIDSVFHTCGWKDIEEGLTLSEVLENNCMDLFGIQDKDIAREIFQTIDENGDGLVSKEESLKKYQTLRMDRHGRFGDSTSIDLSSCF